MSARVVVLGFGRTDLRPGARAVVAAPATVGPMIGYLEGVISGRVVLTTSGVGYVIHTPRPFPQGEMVRLHVCTVVREDAITLYGFADETELAVFEALCRVSGVGASSALSVLRDAGVAAVTAAVRATDPSLLGRIRGVGAKTAARIVSDLKLPDGLDDYEAASAVDTELVGTLVALGFDRVSATDAIAAAGAGDEETVIAAALEQLQGVSR